MQARIGTSNLLIAHIVGHTQYIKTHTHNTQHMMMQARIGTSNLLIAHNCSRIATGN